MEGEPRLGGVPSFAFSDLLARICRMSTMARGSASCCNLSVSLSWAGTFDFRRSDPERLSTFLLCEIMRLWAAADVTAKIAS